MGYLLLAFWYFIIFITVSGLVMLAVSILCGVLVALGICVSGGWALIRGHERRVPRWVRWLDAP